MEKVNLADYLNTLLKNNRQDELRRAIRNAADMIHDNLKNSGDKTTILQQYETLGTHLQESIVVQYSKRYTSPFPGTIPETPSVSKRLDSLQHNHVNSSPESQSSPTEALLIRKKAKSITDRHSHLGNFLQLAVLTIQRVVILKWKTWSTAPSNPPSNHRFGLRFAHRVRNLPTSIQSPNPSISIAR